MQKIDKEKEFIKVNIAVLTVSDSRNIETDKSGEYLFNSIQKAGHLCIERTLIKDEVKSILDILNKWINDPNIDAIIITGGK
jgi:molybdenum cofactor biosynthesis protein B